MENILVPSNQGPPGKWPLKRRESVGYVNFGTAFLARCMQTEEHDVVLQVRCIVWRLVSTDNFSLLAPCRLRGCKNRPAPFPGRMSYKATKPGSVCPVS